MKNYFLSILNRFFNLCKNKRKNNNFFAPIKTKPEFGLRDFLILNTDWSKIDMVKYPLCYLVNIEESISELDRYITTYSDGRKSYIIKSNLIKLIDFYEKDL